MTNLQKDNGSYSNSRGELDFNIGEYLLKLKRRWIPALAVFTFTVGTTAFLSSFLEKTYQSEGKILFKKNTTLIEGIGTEADKLESILDNQTPLSTEKVRITSEPVLQQTIDQLKLEDAEGKPLKPKDFEKRLTVEIVGGTDIISLSYKDPDPVTASKVINTLMDVYINAQISSSKSATETAGAFIDKTLPQVKNNLQSLESRLQDFYEKNQIVDLQEEKKILVGELGNLNRQISSVGAELQGKKAQTASLQNQLGLDLNQAVRADQLANTPQVQSIIEQLGATETQLSQERQRFNDNHPVVASLNEKKQVLNSQLQQLIRQYVGAQVSTGLLQGGNNLKENQLERFISLKIEELSLQTEVSALAQYQQVYLNRTKDIPRLEKQEKTLLREVDTARNSFETLLVNKENLAIQENQKTGNAEVIELGQVPEEGSTGRVALMALGILMGLFLSNLTAVLLEMQDRTLKTIPEIKQKFSYQVLGIVPLDMLQEAQGGIVVQREPDSFASEVYRMIQTNLKFLAVKRQPKVILMTSSVPGEGKSTVAANLAAAMAQLGRKVLLIDGDLRKASQHELWQVSNKAGVKDVIAHKTPLAKVVSQPMKQLDLLTAGVIAPNPLALLDSSEMSELVGTARKEYELIIIDAPPLAVTADVLTLSKLVDGIVFVSRPGVVETESAELAQETIANANLAQKVLGMVINGVKPNEFDRYSYHAKYSKNYFSPSGESSPSKTAPA
ncbi:polysaccharide biosynthesis tyrosine autokinase [Waterburya agarophytonicola K14]|uniref:non-specific protein-tyrosine kinase n=1 Tax=Waterburya agarophytonicola KI4 TaxID=2874699 RepID=A0A964BQ54_9CYAN|nr:polysaccharide biosynthesis tyrosine autokinase [Waterburya agarophytonicola]MCC0177345.1 polysaccharide biosynthesis tyrosine autokinase [Waterburya agarophytonicola KI4]